MLQIHPSVIMNVSDHHTRTKANRPEAEIVIGVLLGKSKVKNIEISDSFELRFRSTEVEGAPSDVETKNELLLDNEFIEKKVALVKQISPDLEMVGWYSTIPFHVSPTEASTEAIRITGLHKQICDFIPDPIYLKLDPYKRESDPKISGTLPLEVFHPVRHNLSDIDFIEVSWTIVTDDIEILGLEHNAKMIQLDVAPSTAIDYLRLQHNAVKMLRDRIKVITKFVKDVQSGALPYHEEPLADIVKLCQQFPLINSDQYTRAYNMQCNDVALNTYLGILTKGSMCKMNFGKPSSKVRALSTTHARR